MTKTTLPKTIIIVGPTASGKTSVSLKLAKKFGCEIISADSRQIYKKMNIGTAKEPGEWKRSGLRKVYYVEGIAHHMIDFLDPGKTYTAAQFRDNALKSIKLTEKHDKIPMIVGGTGLYVTAIVDNYNIPRVVANNKLRSSLEEKTLEELFLLLKTMDEVTAKIIDKKNKRRLIRALEVCILTGEPFSKLKTKGEKLIEPLIIGMDVPREILYERINNRVEKMMEQGLLGEVKGLIKQRYSWQLPSMSGVGYRQFEPYINENQTLEKTIELLKRDTRRYAKRQETWFRRDKRVQWCKSYEKIEKLVADFLQD